MDTITFRAVGGVLGQSYRLVVRADWTDGQQREVEGVLTIARPYARRLASKGVEEELLVHLDYRSVLPAGVSIASVAGVDAVTVDEAASAGAIDAWVLDDDSEILQALVSGGTEGEPIVVRARTVWTDGQRREMLGIVQVREPALVLV